MVATIDRFGLKTYHLRKHRRAVDRFYRTLSARSYKTEVALAYKKRFEKNRDKLFTFLDHDGVPWNNNNAEHAIKAFALLRNVIGSNSTPKGISEYLVLLSISETCECRGVDFLSFLRSGELDIDSLAKSRRAPCAYPSPIAVRQPFLTDNRLLQGDAAGRSSASPARHAVSQGFSRYQWHQKLVSR
jgi:hypothetical protein